MANLDVYEVLKHGYDYHKNPENLAKYAAEKGYKLDGDLSNENHQILYNDAQKKLIHHVVGTQNTSFKKGAYDWAHNIAIGLNHTRSTPRYKEEYDTHKKAVEKYKPEQDHIISHSQGGAHTHELLKDFNKAMGHTFNSAPTNGIFGIPKNNPRENKYRVALDPVSLNNLGLLTNQKTIYRNPFDNVLKQHGIDNFKDQGIKIH